MLQNDKNIPKILIVNVQTIYDDNATGITMRNIFKDWPHNSVMEVFYWKPLVEIEKDKLNIESLCLSEIAVPLNFLIRKVLGKKGLNNFNNGLLKNQINGNSNIVKLKQNIKSFVIGLINVSPLCIANSEVINKVDEFHPDIIYTLGADILPLKMALFFAKRYHKPIVLHCMDNWIETKYASSLWLYPFKLKLRRTIKQVEARMNHGLAISEKMAEEYTKRSGIPYLALMNTTSFITQNGYLEKKDSDVGFTYTGGFHLNRWKELLKVEGCIKKLNSQGIKSKLIIYTSDKDRDCYSNLFDASITQINKYVPHSEISKVYRQSDILVHIESFDSDIIKYTKYSLSTKIPEYMSSGKPILCFAPKELAVYSYILQTKSGISVDNESDLFDAAKKLATNYEVRINYANNGIKAVKRYHTHERATKILQEVFCSQGF